MIVCTLERENRDEMRYRFYATWYVHNGSDIVVDICCPRPPAAKLVLKFVLRHTRCEALKSILCAQFRWQRLRFLCRVSSLPVFCIDVSPSLDQ